MSPDTPPLTPIEPSPPDAVALPYITPDVQLSQNAMHVRAVIGSYDSIFDWIFRLGFATVFLANSWTAVVDSAGFLMLIENNFLARLAGHFQLQLYVIMANDLLLGVLILCGFRRQLVYAWAGAWLIIVTFFKITSLI